MAPSAAGLSEPKQFSRPDSVLESSREQLSRVSSRLAQTAGLTSLDLAAEVVAFSYGAISAAIEVALIEVVEDTLLRLRGHPPQALTPEQLAAVGEASFAAFLDRERARSRFDVKRAFDGRTTLIRSHRSAGHLSAVGSVITLTGVPDREHFHIFFSIATGGRDPRGPLAKPPLNQLVGRVNQIRGPRNDFAHECADPTGHDLVVGRTRDAQGMANEVAKLQAAIGDLLSLLEVLELACRELAASLAGLPAAKRLRWWQALSRQVVGQYAKRPSP